MIARLPLTSKWMAVLLVTQHVDRHQVWLTGRGMQVIFGPHGVWVGKVEAHRHALISLGGVDFVDYKALASFVPCSK